MPSILESGKAQADKVARESAQSVTVGAHSDTGGNVAAAVTYDRTWSNGWALSAYARAWWKGAPVTPNEKPKKHLGGEAGFEATKTF